MHLAVFKSLQVVVHTHLMSDNFGVGGECILRSLVRLSLEATPFSPIPPSQGFYKPSVMGACTVCPIADVAASARSAGILVGECFPVVACVCVWGGGGDFFPLLVGLIS